MQFSRYLTYRKSSSLIRFWPWVLKIGLAAASFYYVFSKLLEEKLLLSEVEDLFKSFDFTFIILLVVILMILNWFLESKKWQLLAKQFQSISIVQAFKAILAGVSLDAVLPFGAGAIGSKVLSLNGSGRQKLIGPVIIAQSIQSFFTIAFGVIGIAQLAKMTNVLSLYSGVQVSILILVLTGLLTLGISKLLPEKKAYYVEAIKEVSKTVWINIVVLSFFRYVIFLVQLLLIATYLAPEIPILVLVGCITWMFFAKTIVPKPGHLGAVGIRGASVVFFLGLAGYSAGNVVLATLILWVINLAIPSLLGLFFIKNLSLNPEVSND